MSAGYRRGLKQAAANAIIIAGSVLGGSQVAAETPMTAGVIAERMEAEDRFPFAAGLVEGVAFSRYQIGGQDTAAMECIFNWFYSGQRRTDLIFETFERFPDYTAGAVVAALTNKACPNE